MDHIAPLIQTVLWVGLVAGIVWRFNKPIEGILTALHKRLDDGSNLKAGPFEISNQLRPQDPASARVKVEAEIVEASEPVAAIQSPTTAADEHDKHTSEPNKAAQFMQVEDLVLRAVQLDFGATINRQVTAGADPGFDGAFVADGRMNIIEVKYAQSTEPLKRYVRSLVRIRDSVERYGWRNVRVILAVAFASDADIDEGYQILNSLASNVDMHVLVRCYSIAELRKRFVDSTAN